MAKSKSGALRALPTVVGFATRHQMIVIHDGYGEALHTPIPSVFEHLLKHLHQRFIWLELHLDALWQRADFGSHIATREIVTFPAD